MNEDQKVYYNCIIISIKTNYIYTYFSFSNLKNTSKTFFYLAFYHHF